jgi:hypothetical protein
MISLPLQLYNFVGMRMMIHISAILTQIIFDHSLKIRLATSAESEPRSSAGPPTGKEEGESRNIVGKINNLITVDVQNITEGRDFVVVCEYHHRTRPIIHLTCSVWYTPIQVVGCTYFLYRLLGWR